MNEETIGMNGSQSAATQRPFQTRRLLHMAKRDTPAVVENSSDTASEVPGEFPVPRRCLPASKLTSDANIAQALVTEALGMQQ